MADLGPVKCFVEMIIERTKTGYKLQQEIYIDSLLLKDVMK